MATPDTPTDLITTPDEFKAALALLKGRGVRKLDLCAELGRSGPALWAWANKPPGPPRYCAVHLKLLHGITKDTVAQGRAA